MAKRNSDKNIQKAERRRAAAERHLLNVAELRNIDLSALSPEQYEQALDEIVKKLSKIPGALR